MTSPTTPRDAIGLSERLRDDIAQLVTAKKHAEFAGAETGVRVKDPSLLLTDLTEAATALDALQGEIRQWANEVARYKAYAEKFEQENDALQARVKELEAEVERNDFNLMVKADAAEARAELAESRATSAEQERDEAYERLKPFADAAESLNESHLDRMDLWESPSGLEITAGHLRAARDLVRRLAAGTEKENPHASD